MAKIHIVGAGPSGSIAAISALRNGHDVIISEEHQSAGLPQNCSGHFSKDGLDSLKPFTDYRKTIINPIRGAHIHLAGERLSVRRGSPVSFVCDRAALDLSLASRAEEDGAKMNYGERISSHFHSEHIIGADGPHSAVARHFSFPPLRKFAATLQAMADYRCEDPDMVEVYLSNEAFPGFFGWVIPHDEHRAEFGVGVELPHRATDAWNRLMKLKGVRTHPRPNGFVIPLEVRARTAKTAGRRNVALVGDAAGQVKATTGGGVVFGGNCAAIAGRSITHAGIYEAEWRGRFGLDLAIHSFIHDYIASQSDRQLAAIGKRLKKLNCEEYLARNGHMDHPTRMLHPEIISHFIKNIAGVV